MTQPEKSMHLAIDIKYEGMRFLQWKGFWKKLSLNKGKQI